MTNQLNWVKDDFENIEEAWKGGLWDRKRLGEQLTNYVDRLQCGAVLALDARWGEGKTWFVRHWKKHLETTQPHKHDVIYLDAFANDYLEDPFLVIASEIASTLDKTADKKLVCSFKKAAAVMQHGLLTIAPSLIASMISCAITGGIIPFIKIDSDSIKDKIDDAVNNVTENIGEKITEAIQNKIESYEEEKNSLFAFKRTLSELAASLDKPLVFIIDELDRCLPDFAIRLIERIKHFFDIPKIVFVLVMNKTQFSRVICHKYGYDETLSEEYLDKFLDFSIILPKNKDSYDDIYSSIESYLINLGFNENQDETYIKLFACLFMHKKINNKRYLRKIVNLFSLLQLKDRIKNELLIYFLFNLNLFDEKIEEQEFIDHIKNDLAEISKNCFAYDIAHIQSGIPPGYEHKVTEESILSTVFKDNIKSNIFSALSNGADQCLIPDYDFYPNNNLQDGWKQYFQKVSFL